MRLTLSRGSVLPCLALAAACGGAAAQSPVPGWQAGAVIDIAAASRALALGQRAQGLELGHSDLSAYGPLGAHLQGQLTASVHTADGKVEGEFEEVWMQTTSLPEGLQLRAGRFASQLGYLNEQHQHADDFVERPLLYRAFLGGHWFDDGLRLNWTAPTDFYLRLGAEVFSGKQLVPEAASWSRPGAYVLSVKTGGDWNASHSWQAGLSYLRNRREATVEEEHGAEEEGGHEEGHAHAHAHGAMYSGKQLWIAELAWKWAPEGNNSREQLRVAYEFAQVSGLNSFATSSDRHRAQYLSVVWRFAPAWEVGARYDTLRVRQPHEDHFEDGKLSESALMLAWKPTHAQTLRVQFTKQKNGTGFDEATRAVQLQYVLSFGAHAAHTY